MRFLTPACVCLLVVGCGGSGGGDPAAPVVAVSSSVAEEKTLDIDSLVDKLLREYLDAEAKAYDKVQTRAQFDAIGDLIFKL